MTIPYSDFIARRAARVRPVGIDVGPGDLHHSLKPFQVDVTRWAARVGRPAVWADTGLGKTRMQLEWCRVMADVSLIVAPLGVARQTPEEAALIHTDARYVRSGDEITGPGVYVTNYEMVDQFDPSKIGAVALDEASILKQSDGKTRTKLIRHFENVEYRSTWTATPAPNDPEELTNQAEFLGHMTRANMLAAYFVHDQDGWRLKGHAVEPMLDWMGTWAIAIRRPSDLGYADDGYNLPGLNIIPELVDVEIEPADGELFAMTIGGVQGRSKVRRESLAARVDRAVELVERESDEPWLLWTGLNDEADAIADAIPGSVNVHGSMSPDEKADLLLGFAHGDFRVLITKLKIAGLGMNYQHSARMAFVGLNDSYEQYYQGIRRSFRYGQTRVVNAHIVLSEIESQIAENVARKESQANRVIDGLIARNTTRRVA
ncbi:DEAD/DEAH box helicase [Microbacterium luteum]|uniref:helicase-related protein n=1 Tax=Microbacterium luteum TaxID=2782167 RepID=UPI001886FBB4|nr:DEAD/DEAH box helicase [Microbacterium luteum]